MPGEISVQRAVCQRKGRFLGWERRWVGPGSEKRVPRNLRFQRATFSVRAGLTLGSATFAEPALKFARGFERAEAGLSTLPVECNKN